MMHDTCTTDWRFNQINLFKLEDVRSGCPISRAGGSCIKRSSSGPHWNLKVFVFLGEGKTGVPGDKPVGAEKRANKKLKPHMTPSPGIETRITLVGERALTTAPSLLPNQPCTLMNNSLEEQVNGFQLSYL